MERSASIRTWQRLEGRARSHNVERGIQARVHDPAWFLARQWQCGEFVGEHAGSPVSTQIELEAAALTRYGPGPSAEGKSYNPAHLPLEVLVEQENFNSHPRAAHTAAVAGQQWVRLLKRLGIGSRVQETTLEAFPLPSPPGEADPESVRLLHVVSGRVPDGNSLFTTLQQMQVQGRLSELIERLEVDARDESAFIEAANTFIEWYSSLYGTPSAGVQANDAWVPERMEYALSVAAPSSLHFEVADVFTIAGRGTVITGSVTQGVLRAGEQVTIKHADGSTIHTVATRLERRGQELETAEPGEEVGILVRGLDREDVSRGDTITSEVVLTAPRYRGGRLDWYEFNLDTRRSLGATSGDALQMTRNVLPTPVTFAGMPHPRWWTFEDARVDLGALDTAPEDLTRMLLTNFALSYGNDWFIAPVDLPVGTIARTQRMRVMDSFGEITEIEPVSRRNHPSHPNTSWQLFQLSVSTDDTGNPDPALFFLSPSLPASNLQSRPIEKVHFIRDEAANHAWGIERIAPSPVSGKPLDRYERHQALRQTGRDILRYPPSGAQIYYRLATEVPNYWIPLIAEPRGARAMIFEQGLLLNTETGHAGTPLGRLLGDNFQYLHEEEVPRAGAQVTRNYQYARWTDGASHLWIGRRKRTGRGEGSSGLRFDAVAPMTERTEPVEGTPSGRVSIHTLLRYASDLDTPSLQSLRAHVQSEAAAAGVDVSESPETVMDLVTLMARYLRQPED